ncbi:MAG: hypothetical protein E6R04_03945 [Spirochaetes bacterium]|nr:MAG: hypothetical protein E6R04_03945 [Spirochaetota bacterium]
MTKPIVQVHTIDQWMEVDPEIRGLILKNIKLKDRLFKFLKDRNDSKGPTQKLGDWNPCAKCETKGWVPAEPRLPGIHPSQLPHPCMLKIYFELIGAPSSGSFEARLQLIFDLGHAVHDMFQSYGKSGAWGPIYTPEATISQTLQEKSEQLMIEGHADAENVLTVDIPGSSVLYEVGVIHEYKTMNNRNFEKLTQPKPEHKVQAMVYAACLNRPVVAYLYFNKDNQNLADFPVQFNTDLWVQIEAKALIILDAFKKKEPPPGSTGFHCQQCQFVLTCPAYKQSLKKG